jgi:hypothetical protein
LLVRYLDAWVPIVLHGHRRATYVHSGEPELAAAAVRVFAEFTDLLAKHALAMILVGPPPATTAMAGHLTAPPGLALSTAAELPPLDGADPVLAYLDGTGGSLSAAALGNLGKRTEILLSLPAGTPADGLRRDGLDTVVVELVDGDRNAETLLFATASPKALEKFKDELWALDEYAGIRYRDPHDPEGTLLDISLRPNLGPLRRELVEYITTAGSVSVGDLRQWTLRETIYRVADAIPAIQALVAGGLVHRQPPGGRLTTSTLITR